MKRGDEAAYPTESTTNALGGPEGGELGLTKRELIAAMALQGLLADYSDLPEASRVAEIAVEHADALLEELSK